ncbi:uncharacterized protein [Labrus bergylta]|uniref:uncharacterized protein n=1 Tax=Labrus bergylta TaxID=56723 RepID=UPI0033138E19
MTVWDKRVLCSFVLILAGAVAQSVNYPPPVCAVTGSTAVIPCTFSPRETLIQDGREVPTEIVRVRWCQNHQICHGSTPNVYDSRSPNNNNRRYKYLGDLKKNCTLQIKNVNKMEDEATLRFRMEVNYTLGHFTGTSGANVTVTDMTPLKIKNSGGDRNITEGRTVTLSCTAPCLFHPLAVTWLRDGHVLSESGPALKLGPLTAEDSGYYTCALTTKIGFPSQPYHFRVTAKEEEEGLFGSDVETVNKLLIIRVVVFALHSLLIITVASIVIKRMFFQKAAEVE